MLITPIILLSSNAFAHEFACHDIDIIIKTGNKLYEIDNLNYYAASGVLSRLVIYKEKVTTDSQNEFAITPILFAGKKKFYLNYDYYKHMPYDSGIPRFVAIYTADFNNNGLDELVILTEDEGYLSDIGGPGHVRDTFVAPDQDTLNSVDSCVINPYPYINDHLSGIRSTYSQDRDASCEGRVCTVTQIKRELKRLQHLSPEQFLHEAHKQALYYYKDKSIWADELAYISNVAFLYKNALSDDTVTDLNDMGFFKEEAKEYDKAVLILEPIAQKYPNRAVVFLNLADAYYGLNEIDKARDRVETLITWPFNYRQFMAFLGSIGIAVISTGISIFSTMLRLSQMYP